METVEVLGAQWPIYGTLGAMRRAIKVMEGMNGAIVRAIVRAIMRTIVGAVGATRTTRTDGTLQVALWLG